MPSLLKTWMLKVTVPQCRLCPINQRDRLAWQTGKVIDASHQNDDDDQHNHDVARGVWDPACDPLRVASAVGAERGCWAYHFPAVMAFFERHDFPSAEIITRRLAKMRPSGKSE